MTTKPSRSMLAMLAVLLALPVAAEAQLVGSHRNDPERPSVPQVTGDPARQSEMNRKAFADCVVTSAHARKLALQFIAMDPETPEAKEFGQKVSEPRCLPDVGQTKYVARMAFSTFLWRYELLGALYRQAYQKVPDADLKDLPVGDYATEFASGTVPASILSLRQFGDCVARMAPVESHELVRSNIYTDVENEAIKAVLPKLQACMPTGQTVSFGRAILRGALAEGLFRLREASDRSESVADA